MPRGRLRMWRKLLKRSARVRGTRRSEVSLWKFLATNAPSAANARTVILGCAHPLKPLAPVSFRPIRAANKLRCSNAAHTRWPRRLAATPDRLGDGVETEPLIARMGNGDDYVYANSPASALSMLF